LILLFSHHTITHVPLIPLFFPPTTVQPACVLFKFPHAIAFTCESSQLILLLFHHQITEKDEEMVLPLHHPIPE
jgi:hypothetical protein